MTLGDTKPFFFATPRQSLGELHTEIVRVEQKDFLIRRPVKSDILLGDASVLKANAQDDYMPYWADIWPAARMLAKAVLRMPVEANQPPPRVLELGCGLGVAGLAALSRGWHVTFSDYDTTSIEFAAENARLNGFTHFETLAIDWRCPPPRKDFTLILGADLIYEERNHGPLLTLIRQMLPESGRALFTDPDRVSSEAFQKQLKACGLVCAQHFIRAGEPGGTRYKGTLYEFRWPG